MHPPPSLPRVLLLLLALLAAPVPAEAGEAPSKSTADLDLSLATVVASPGCPEGLHRFLPGGRRPATLTWPLPDGPLLVLGLPREDEVAADLARLWHLVPTYRGLCGGYVVCAWHDGARPIAAIFAHDASALWVARRELERGVRLPRREHVRPVYRVRAHDPRGGLREATERAIATGANRLWIDLERESEPNILRALPQLARHGILPVASLPHRAPGTTVASALDARKRYGITRLAVRVRSTGGVAAEAHGRQQERLARTLSRQLVEEHGFEDLVIVPEDGTGRTRTHGRPPRLGGTTETALAWSGWGRSWHEDEVSSWATPETVRQVGVPVLFYETWALRWSRPNPARGPLLPSRPRHRDPALGALFAGIVVAGGEGTELALAEAWSGPPDDTRDVWERELLPLLPRSEPDPRAFLAESARRLAASAGAPEGAAPWKRPLAAWLAHQARTLPAGAVGVPRVPSSVRADHALDEGAWAFAARRKLHATIDGRDLTWELLAFADGRHLYLALRAPERIGPLTLVFDGVATATLQPRGGARRDGTVTWEHRHHASWLQADAYPTRVVHLEIRRGENILYAAPLVLMP